MEDDWDLHAVVRGCSAVTTTTSPSLTSISATTSTATAITGSSSTTNTPSFAVSDFYASSNSIPFPFGRDPVNHLFSLQDPFEATSSSEELHELYKPFFFKSQPQPSLLLPPPPPPSPSPQPPPQLLASPTTTFSPLSPLSSLSSSKVQTHKKQHSHLHKQSHAGSVSTPRSKRRKNQLKKVCQVPAESLSSDIWAWRKYGQKPIKGSPYPRGYYRCSSSKGCMARKQVERNRSDPGMFIVTYTAEHNHPAPTHRNSLAGSTRQKPIPAQPVEACEPNKIEPKQPACSASPSGEDEVLAQSTISESKEEKEDLVEDEEDDDLGISDMIVNDDFFVGFAELDSPHSDDCFSDQFPANFGLPWLFNNAATAAGGI